MFSSKVEEHSSVFSLKVEELSSLFLVTDKSSFIKKMSSAALNINYQSIRPEGGKFFCFILESVLLLLLLSAVQLGQVRSRTLQRTRQEEKQDMGPTIHKSPATFLSVVREPLSVLLILPALVPLVVFACTSRNTQGSS